MEFKNLTYLLLLLIFMILPGFITLQKKVRITLNIRFLIPAILFTGVIFIIWDIRFTELGIWNFNPDFLTGYEILKLPIEEWLAFIVIPLSAAIIFEYVKIIFHKFEKANLFLSISLILVIVCGIIAFVHRQKLYTFFTFFLLVIYFGYIIFRNKFKKHYTKFYISYFISLVPYFLFSEILNALPVKSYDFNHVLNISVLAVPVENMGYYFLMFLMVITIYENLKERKLFG